MICSYCEIKLEYLNINNIIIDICPTCQGIFLDKGELQKILENKEECDGNLLKFIETGCIKEEKLWQNEIECPKCHQFMQKFPYAGSSDIIIDSCRNGCGIWLDKGEIFKIADYLTKTSQPLDSKQQDNIKQMLSTLDKKKELNIWELLSKRYSNNAIGELEMSSDLASSPSGKYITIIMSVLQGIVFFLLRKR